MVDELFLEAYPLAQRAAEVRSAATVRLLRAIGIDREDLEQEVIIAVWRALRTFDPVRASLRTFIERVVATRVSSVTRRAIAQKRTRPDFAAPLEGTVKIAVTVELHVDVRRALRTLSLADQKMARLLLVYKPAEIARECGISRAAVYRSRERIAAALKDFGLKKC